MLTVFLLLCRLLDPAYVGGEPPARQRKERFAALKDLTLCKGGARPQPVRADPPVTERRTEIRQAQKSQSALSRARKSVMNTIFAGETGGYSPMMPGQTGGKKKLGAE